MKIENMNTIDIDIYKMKGIYIIIYEYKIIHIG